MERDDVQAHDDLQQGRAAFARRMWLDAFKALTAADEDTPLDADDLVQMAWSAYLIGRLDDFVRTMERTHHGHLEAHKTAPASRCALWLGFVLAHHGEIGPAMGWFARAERLLDVQSDCVERGYLLLPGLFQHAMTGSWEAVHAVAVDALAVGERFAEPDLTAVSLHWQGRALLRLGRVDEGLARLDESMVSVGAGELSPFVTGVIYCSLIEACQEIYALQRSQQWTRALSRWCDGQPDLVPFTGRCLVHRAELMVLRGMWKEALQEARRAGELAARGGDHLSGAAAQYLQGEVLRLMGDVAPAGDAYRQASELGWDPQPGLALLRLASGDNDAAVAAVRRGLSEQTEPLERARMLPAYVEIALAVGDVDAASTACGELEHVAARWPSPVIGAIAAGASGAVAAAKGDPSGALPSLRHACAVWRQFDAPYEVARLRVMVGLACAALGDQDGAGMELSAARAAFQRLGAAPDVARVEAFLRGTPLDVHGLTDRELEVLRLVAAGVTNKSIAAELFVSEKTVDRHVSNILTKLGVGSRTAATAYAYQHRLI